MLALIGLVAIIAVVGVIDIAAITLENEKLNAKSLDRPDFIRLDKEVQK